MEENFFWYFVIVTVKGSGAHHDIPSVLKVQPNQASGLQDADGVNHSHLADNILGSGSGWQQSRQNSTLVAVTGRWTRMQCRVLWRILSITTPPFVCLCTFMVFQQQPYQQLQRQQQQQYSNR